MKTTQLSTRAQNIVDLLQVVLLDLAEELRKDYDEVDIKVNIAAE